MMTKDQEREFFKQTFTVQGRIFHPNLLAPSARKEGDALKYSVMLAWPKNSNGQIMQTLNAFVQQAMQTFHPTLLNNPALIRPVKDFDTYMREDGKPNPDYVQGHFWVNASSGAKFTPVVVGPDRQQIFSDAEVWSGRNAAVNISFYNLSGANGGKRGLGVNVNAVMLLEGGEQIMGGATVDVNTIFGNFQADMGMINTPAPAPQQYAPPAQAPAAPPAAPQYAPPAAPQYAPPAAPQYDPAAGNGQQPQQQYAPPAAQPQNTPGIPTTPPQVQPGHMNQGGYAQPAYLSNTAQPEAPASPFGPPANNQYV